ncbi:MAG: hypothetical protein ABJE95_05900 [Byssovorax sp.]
MRFSPRNVVGLVVSLAIPIVVGCTTSFVKSAGGFGGDSPSSGEAQQNVCSGSTVGGFDGVGGGPGIPPGVWAKRYGDAEDQRALAVAVNNAGEIAIAGAAKGTINFGNLDWTGSATDTDVVIAKLSSDGYALWSRRYGDSCDQRGSAVAHTPAGNVLLAGDFCGKMDFGNTAVETKGAEIDAFVVMLDALGEDVYSRSFGGNGAQILRGAAVDAKGNAVLVGSFDQAFDAGAGIAQTAGLDDSFVVELDPKGNVLWSLTLGGPGADIARSVAVDPLGNVIVGGSFAGTIDLGDGPVTATVGHTNGFLLALDPGGKHLWSKSFGGDDDVVIGSVAAGPDGEVAATGYFLGTADLGSGPTTSSGAEDGFVEVTSNAGDHVWGMTVGGEKFQRGTGVAIGANGDVVISGVSDEIVPLNTTLQSMLIGTAPGFFGPSMGYALRFDAAGTPLAVWEVDNGGPIESAGVGIDGTQGIVLAGSFKKSLGFLAGTLVTSGGWDVFVARAQ